MNIKQTILMTTAAAAGLLGATGIVSADQVTIKSGDTLASIAQAHHTTTDKLAQINHIENPDMIFAGELLETEGQASIQTTVVAPAQTAVAATPAPKQQTVAPVEAKVTTSAVTHTAAPKAQVATQATAPTQTAAPKQQGTTQTVVAPKEQATTQATSAPAAGGSTYAQFLANGGSAALWESVVMPESEGNPNAVSANGYRGLGQTKEGWGTGSVAQQTQGMVNYANSRYGSVSSAVAFRQANGWW